MIEIMAASKGNLLAVKATEKLTTEDYEKVFIPKLEELLRQNNKIKALICFGDNFHGWELGAAWDDTRFGMKHHNDFEKIALVGAPGWVNWGTKIGAHFISGQVEIFAADQLNAALNWISE